MYTVWSRGRLIGQSTLGYRQSAPDVRAGDFVPSALGEKLMPVITGVGPALRALYRISDDVVTNAEGQADGDPVFDYSPTVRRTTEYADVVSIGDELESLALELRGPDGEVVPTEHIWMNDTEYLLSLANEPDSLANMELSPEEEEAIAHDLEMILKDREERGITWDPADDDAEVEDWGPPTEFARYQLLVVLAGGRMGARRPESETG
jgi:hypothetical protein